MAQINKSNEYFNTVLYTGNGSTNAITGVGFQPDLVWVKCRNDGFHHSNWDIVRGTSNALKTSQTSAEAIIEGVTSFDSDGFTLSTSANGNSNTKTYASWNWLADNTSGSSNTDGSITSTVSANTTSGFSIVTYTGNGSSATVGHSLGAIPSMYIVKERSGTEAWNVYHKTLGAGNYLMLQSTNASASSTTLFDNTEPTSSLFSVGVDAGTNGSTKTYVAYCFAEKKGFSKFGSYVGNQNSSNGTFVYTGFKPAFILLKRTDAVANWFMFDVKRNTYNTLNNYIWANSSQAEAVGGTIDFYSNGFKLFTSWTEMNASGGTYIYMAFAENPLVGTNNIPTTAR